MNVEQFAQVVLEQTQARLKAAYPDSPQWEWEVVQVKPGKVYTKVDIGPRGNISGKYMVENSTGEIFGIKGYGRVHKGHRYGTLATVGEFYWGGYTGVPLAPEDVSYCGKVCPCPPPPGIWYAGTCSETAGHWPQVPHSASGCCYYDDSGNLVAKPT